MKCAPHLATAEERREARGGTDEKKGTQRGKREKLRSREGAKRQREREREREAATFLAALPGPHTVCRLL